MSHWIDLTHNLNADENVEVWLISTDAGKKAAPIIAELEKNRLPFELCVYDILAYTLETGLDATPMTIVTDREMHPALAYAGVMTDAIDRQFSHRLSSIDGITNPFVERGSGEPVL